MLSIVIDSSQRMHERKSLSPTKFYLLYGKDCATCSYITNGFCNLKSLIDMMQYTCCHKYYIGGNKTTCQKQIKRTRVVMLLAELLPILNLLLLRADHLIYFPKNNGLKENFIVTKLNIKFNFS